ncbi:MAG: hypothetical protein V4671_25620 [Armatimonadota bacterium]
MPDPIIPTFRPKQPAAPQTPETPDIPEGFDGVAIPSPNGEATYYSRKGLTVGSRVLYTDENGSQRAWVIQSMNEEKDEGGQTSRRSMWMKEVPRARCEKAIFLRPGRCLQSLLLLHLASVPSRRAQDRLPSSGSRR